MKEENVPSNGVIRHFPTLSLNSAMVDLFINLQHPPIPTTELLKDERIDFGHFCYFYLRKHKLINVQSFVSVEQEIFRFKISEGFGKIFSRM